MCRLFWNLGASASWNPRDLSRPVMGLIFLLPCLTLNTAMVTSYSVLCSAEGKQGLWIVCPWCRLLFLKITACNLPFLLPQPRASFVNKTGDMGGMDYVCLAQNTNKWRATVNTKMNNWRVEAPTRCHLWFYCTSYRLNMFRALLCPLSWARDYDVDYHIGRFGLGLLLLKVRCG